MQIERRRGVRNVALGCCALGLFGHAPSSHAGGLYLNEFGTTSMGTAGAGAQAFASDASTSFHNPAGMTRLEHHEFQAGAGLLAGDIRFDRDPATTESGGNGGQQGGPGPILSAFYVHDLAERVKLGMNLISVSGAVLDPNNDWTGRFQVQELTLLTLTANPTVAVRATDWLSLGAGAVLMYGRLNYDLAAMLPDPPGGEGRVKLKKLDDFEPGFTASALVELSPRTRFGVQYVSEVELDLSGDIKLQGVGLEANVDTRIPFVQAVRGGIYHELNDRIALVASAGWENWSEFGNQFVKVGSASGKIPRNWKDTWFVAGGIHYKPTDRWMLQTGFKYDSSPVSDSDRTADMPIDRQIRAALGAYYRVSERLTLGGSFVYANYGDADIKSSNLIGHYRANQIFFFALSVNWKWLKGDD